MASANANIPLPQQILLTPGVTTEYVKSMSILFRECSYIFHNPSTSNSFLLDWQNLITIPLNTWVVANVFSIPDAAVVNITHVCVTEAALQFFSSKWKPLLWWIPPYMLWRLLAKFFPLQVELSSLTIALATCLLAFWIHFSPPPLCHSLSVWLELDLAGSWVMPRGSRMCFHDSLSHPFTSQFCALR